MYLGKSRPVWTVFPAMFVMLFIACSAESPPSPPPPSDTPSATPTITPAPTVNPTPTLLATVPPTTAGDDRVFIQLTDPLDEPEYYCVDVPGAGVGVRLENPLQAHTCKPLETAADELFIFGRPSPGKIYMAAYDVCVEAEEAAEGSPLRLQRCSDSQNQLFSLDNGLIRLIGAGGEKLCLAVDSGSGIPTGGPSHLRRALTLESCQTTERALMSWSVGLFDY